MNGGSLPQGPYKGLAPFEDSELDALLFFGRERDSEIVVANLLAARLTVLYGRAGSARARCCTRAWRACCGRSRTRT